MSFITHQFEGIAIVVWTNSNEFWSVPNSEHEYGWHGLNIEPVSGEWIADYPDDEQIRGAIVIIEETTDTDDIDNEFLNLPQGWHWKFAELEEGQIFNDGTFKAIVCSVENDGSVKVAGMA